MSENEASSAIGPRHRRVLSGRWKRARLRSDLAFRDFVMRVMRFDRRIPYSPIGPDCRQASNLRNYFIKLRWLLHASVFALALIVVTPTARSQQPAIVQDPIDGVAESSSPELERLQWQQHIVEERQRIREFAAKRRLGPISDPALPQAQDEDRSASERVRGDETLERGDIIVTSEGMFVFMGQKYDERSPSDFKQVENPPVRSR